MSESDKNTKERGEGIGGKEGLGSVTPATGDKEKSSGRTTPLSAPNSPQREPVVIHRRYASDGYPQDWAKRVDAVGALAIDPRHTSSFSQFNLLGPVSDTVATETRNSDVMTQPNTVNTAAKSGDSQPVLHRRKFHVRKRDAATDTPEHGALDSPVFPKQRKHKEISRRKRRKEHASDDSPATSSVCSQSPAPGLLLNEHSQSGCVPPFFELLPKSVAETHKDTAVVGESVGVAANTPQMHSHAFSGTGIMYGLAEGCQGHCGQGYVPHNPQSAGNHLHPTLLPLGTPPQQMQSQPQRVAHSSGIHAHATNQFPTNPLFVTPPQQMRYHPFHGTQSSGLHSPAIASTVRMRFSDTVGGCDSSNAGDGDDDPIAACTPPGLAQPMQTPLQFTAISNAPQHSRVPSNSGPVASYGSSPRSQSPPTARRLSFTSATSSVPGAAGGSGSVQPPSGPSVGGGGNVGDGGNGAAVPSVPVSASNTVAATNGVNATQLNLSLDSLRNKVHDLNSRMDGLQQRNERLEQRESMWFWLCVAGMGTSVLLLLLCLLLLVYVRRSASRRKRRPTERKQVDAYEATIQREKQLARLFNEFNRPLATAKVDVFADTVSMEIPQ